MMVLTGLHCTKRASNRAKAITGVSANFTNHHRRAMAAIQAAAKLAFNLKPVPSVRNSDSPDQASSRKEALMTFKFKPSASFNSLILAGLLATLGTSAMAQGAPTAPPAGPHSERMGRHDPAKMQAMMARHQAEMKAKLKITPAQEGAWNTFTAAMQPPAHSTRATPEQHAEFEKLTTPQRIDKMRAMRTERMTQMNATMDQRGEATKTLYAALSPEQQKVFDTEHAKRGHRGEHGGRGGQRG